MELITSFNETNQNLAQQFPDLVDSISAVGNSFDGNNSHISSAKFNLKRTGTPTGTLTAKLYAISNRKPTASALAVSEEVDISTISNSVFELTNFSFGDTYQVSTGTEYVLVLEGENVTGTSANYIEYGLSDDYLSSEGDYSEYDGTWTTNNFLVLIFYVYGRSNAITGISTIQGVSTITF